MPSQVPLSAMAQVALDGSGNGTASVGPTGFGEVWSQLTVSVHCATNVSEASCRVYAGASASPNFFSDGTLTGSSGDSTTNLPPAIPGGQQVFAVWQGGDAGTTAYLTVTGVRQVA